MREIQTVAPGAKVLIGDVPGRVEYVRVDASLAPVYGLSWWDGRQRYFGDFFCDEFTVVDDAGTISIGFGGRD